MEKRASKRIPVDLRTELRIGGRTSPALVYDLSQGGCMLECSTVSLGEDDELALALMGRDHDGFVVWQRGNCAGVQFVRELPPVLVTALGFKPTDRDFRDIMPRDRFGRRLPSLSLKQPPF